MLRTWTLSHNCHHLLGTLYEQWDFVLPVYSLLCVLEIFVFNISKLKELITVFQQQGFMI